MTRSQPDVQSLLARLRSEPSAPISDEEEALREARVSRRIDEQVAVLDRQRRARARRLRLGSVLLLAAGVALAWFRVSGSHSRAALIAIDREPPRHQAASEVPLAPTPRVNEQPAAPAPRARPSALVRVSEPPPRAPESPPTAASAPSAPPADAPPEASAEAASSTLSAENQLFRSAAEAERAGDVPAALGKLSQLLESFPRSPIAQNALARKFRLLAQGGRSAEAARAAADYLQAFPQGFAEREARRVINAGGANPLAPGESK
jgi:hypothetical protein